MGIQSADTFVRPIYAGSAIATVKSHDEVKIFTVRAASWEAAVEGDATAEVNSASAEGLGASEYPRPCARPCTMLTQLRSQPPPAGSLRSLPSLSDPTLDPLPPSSPADEVSSPRRTSTR